MESATRFDLKLDRDEKDLFAEAASRKGIGLSVSVDDDATLDIPDTPEGRYEMVAMHLVLVLERLRAGKPSLAGRGSNAALSRTKNRSRRQRRSIGPKR